MPGRVFRDRHSRACRLDVDGAIDNEEDSRRRDERQTLGLPESILEKGELHSRYLPWNRFSAEPLRNHSSCEAPKE